VGPRAGLDAVEKRKISCPLQKSALLIQFTACHYANRIILAPVLGTGVEIFYQKFPGNVSEMRV
jgi:hypothetical protein